MPRIQLPNNWKPRPYQLKAWSYLEKGGRHAELVWHRRAGKDELGLHWTAVAAFQRPATYWYCLPQYNQARKAIWTAINPHTSKKRIDEAFPLELRKTTRNQEMMIEFKNGSTFQVVGSDNPDSLVGSPPAGCVYSEWALSNPDVRAYLRPIFTENHGWQIFNTTPRGRNHALRTLLSAKADPDAFGEVLSAEQTGILTPEQLQKELKAYMDDFGQEYGRSKFEQEYLCSFDAANLGAILAAAIGRLETGGRINDDVEFDDHGMPLEIFADLGRRDTATWWFWQAKMGGYSIVDHDSGWGLDAEDWCHRLEERINQYRLAGKKTALGRIWLPHDARAKTFAAKNSAVEIFIKHFGAEHVRITPNSRVSDRVNAARVMVERCEFHAANCEKGLEALRAWSYEYDDEKKTFSNEPLHDWASHDGDGFSYGCLVMQMAQPPMPQSKPAYPLMGNKDGSIRSLTLDEMWAVRTTKSQRI